MKKFKLLLTALMLVAIVALYVGCPNDSGGGTVDTTKPVITKVTIGGTDVVHNGTVAILGNTATLDVVITASDTNGTEYQITTDATTPTTWQETSTISYIFTNGTIYYIWVKNDAGKVSSEFKVTARTTVYVNPNDADTTEAGTQDNPAKTIEKALTLLTNGGAIMIMDDITIGDTINISKAVTLKSNVTSNVVVKRDPAFLQTLINVAQGGNLTIETIIIDGQGTAPNSIIADSALITVATGGELTLTNGAILRNNNHTYQDGGNFGDGSGGGVLVATNAKLTMNGTAVITGNTAFFGGGVCVDNGTFDMTGGTITNNISKHATNPPLSEEACGGGVFVHDAKLTMSGTATITENTAYAGGGVYSTIAEAEAVQFNLKNTAYAGGGVYSTASDSTFDMTGGTISNNTGIGGVLFGGTFNLGAGGKITISDNKQSAQSFTIINVAYDNTTDSIGIPNITGILATGSSIGLTPITLDGEQNTVPNHEKGVVVVKKKSSYTGAINPLNFFLDAFSANTDKLVVDLTTGNLVVK